MAELKSVVEITSPILMFLVAIIPIGANSLSMYMVELVLKFIWINSTSDAEMVWPVMTESFTTQYSAPLFEKVEIKIAEANDATIKVIANGNLALCDFFVFLMRALNYLLQHFPTVCPHRYFRMRIFSPQ